MFYCPDVAYTQDLVSDLILSLVFAFSARLSVFFSFLFFIVNDQEFYKLSGDLFNFLFCSAVVEEDSVNFIRRFCYNAKTLR